MRRTIRRNLGVTLALLSSVPLAARADDSSDLEGLLSETVVTGASRTAETSSDAPAVSTSISGKEMKRYGMRTIDEAINYLGLGMSVASEWQTGQYSANGVAFQDDFNRHILFIIDGVVQNEQYLGGMFTGPMLGLPLDMVDHIEVILGPGSVLYGSQAMLGVINIVTKSASDYKGVHVVLDNGVSPGLNANNDIIAPKLSNLGNSMRLDVSAATQFQLFGKQAGLTVGIEKFDDNGPQLGFGLQKAYPLPHAPTNFGPNDPAGYWGGTANLTNYRHTFGAYTRLTVGEVTASVRFADMHYAVPFYDFLYKGQFNDPQSSARYTMGIFDVRWDHPVSQRLSLLTRVYGAAAKWDRTDVMANTGVGLTECPKGPVQNCVENFGGASSWLGVEAQGNMDWLGDDHQVTMVGADGSAAHVVGGNNVTDQLTGLPYGATPQGNGSYTDKLDYGLGLYAQHRAHFGSFFSANVGIRADFDTVNPNPSLFSGISPRLALVQSIDNTFNIKEVFSSAFRSPSYAELYQASDTLIGVGKLRPEKVKQGTLILDKRFGQQHFILSGFYALWEDMINIAIADNSNHLEFQNTAKIQNYGGNFSFDGALLDQRLRLGLNFTVAKGVKLDQPSGPETVAMAPNVFGNARISYDLQNDLPVVALAANAMGPRLADNAFIAGVHSNLAPWPVAPPNVDLRATVSGPVPTMKGVSYRVGADYLVGKWLPFVVGPISGVPETSIPTPFPSALAPANRMTVFATVQVDLTP